MGYRESLILGVALQSLVITVVGVLSNAPGLYIGILLFILRSTNIRTDGL